MINSVAIQRLLEAATMLKLERGLRSAGSQAAPANSATTNTQRTVSANPLSPATAQNALQATNWKNPPIITREAYDMAAASIVGAQREAQPAPVAYRDTIADATPTARLPEQATIFSAAIPAPVQYANPELALALSVKASRAVHDPTKALGTGRRSVDQGAKSAEEIAGHQRLIFARAICGAIAATVTILIAVLI